MVVVVVMVVGEEGGKERRTKRDYFRFACLQERVIKSGTSV